MDSASLQQRLDILTRSVDALLRWAESHPLTQWADMGVLSALRSELEEAMHGQGSGVSVHEPTVVRVFDGDHRAES